MASTTQNLFNEIAPHLKINVSSEPGFPVEYNDHVNLFYILYKKILYIFIIYITIFFYVFYK